MTLLGVDETAAALLDCVMTRFEEEEAPFCVGGVTVGMPVIQSCCDCGDGEGEAWIHLVRVFRVSGASLQDATPAKPCQPAQWAAEFTITLARCFPTIDETGEVPPVEDRTEAAGRFHRDAATLFRAVHCCEGVEPARITQIQAQTNPEGGCSFLASTIQVPVSLAYAANVID